MKPINPLLLCDSYKLGHADQYPSGTEFVYSNFTPRSLKHAEHIFKNSEIEQKIVVFGLQAVLKEMNQMWVDGFFNQPKEQVINEFIDFITNSYLPKNNVEQMAKRLSDLHDFGKLPIKVNALTEGGIVEVKTPVFTIVNTDPKFYWITNYLETWLSANLWKVMTSATIAHVYRQIITKYAKQTGVLNDFINWQCHDFSMRGMSGIHDARLTGMGHLTSFYGSDTLISAQYIQEMYGDGLPDNYIIAGSVPATEHSVMCLGSIATDNDNNGEFKLFKRLIEEIYPSGVVSIVSDTWDYWKVVTEYLPLMKGTITSRNGKVVIRPDSGDPIHIIAGYRLFKTLTEPLTINSERVQEIYQEYVNDKNSDDKCIVEYENQYYEIVKQDNNYHVVAIEDYIVNGSIETMWNIFGGTTGIGENGKTYKTLHQNIGLIYGDSITIERCHEILQRLEQRGFSSANVVFGVGSYTYNYNSRDTFGFAMKATYGIINGKGFNVMKDPKTDTDKMKKSATGLLKVVNGKLQDQYQLKDGETVLNYNQGELETIFMNGEFIKTVNFAQIREKLLNN